MNSVFHCIYLWNYCVTYLLVVILKWMTCALNFLYEIFVIKSDAKNSTIVIYLRSARMCRKGYGTHSVDVSVCYHKICCLPRFYVENNISQGSSWCFLGFVVWLSLKTLRSRVMASFAGHCCLSRSLMNFRWTNETAMASFLLCMLKLLTQHACTHMAHMILLLG